MGNYNENNTHILATHEQGDNTRMLLLHTCDSGRLEYVIGSYFTVHKMAGLDLEDEYSWDWGHYFQDVVDAVDYWKREVLCNDFEEKVGGAMHMLHKGTIEKMWRDFDVPINEYEEIDDDWCGWERLTPREEIWTWFDKQYARYGGVYALMFPSERKG